MLLQIADYKACAAEVYRNKDYTGNRKENRYYCMDDVGYLAYQIAVDSLNLEECTLSSPKLGISLRKIKHNEPSKKRSLYIHLSQ